MSHVYTAEKLIKPRFDRGLLLSVILLMLMGLVVLFSASPYRSNILYDSPFVFFINQLLYAVVGFILAFIIIRIKPELIRKIIPILLLVSLFLMILTLVMGAILQGAQRWLSVAGVSFQPSELVKLVVILYLASFFDKRSHKAELEFRDFLPPFIVLILFAGLIYLQNSFSIAFFLVILGLSILFMAGVKLRFFVIALLIIAPLGIGAIVAKEYRIDRLFAFMDPERDPAGSGYHVLAAQASIRSGDFLGKGIGMGERKAGSLPEAQGDYIFAVASEELGFVGVLCNLGFFGFFAYKGYRVSLSVESMFDKLAAFGITTAIVLQALFNIAVAGGLLPPTGITLPFFSSGGSSLLLTFIMVGVLLNISTRAKGGSDVHA